MFDVICLVPGHDYGGEERAASDNFGPGEWDDRKVRHAFIRKVRCGLGLGGGLGKVHISTCAYPLVVLYL